MSPTVASVSTVPAGLLTTNGIGFKDWSLVCDALGQGRQSLILRKGGIAEGRQGFRFKHEAFFLFPTQYHQQSQRVRPEELSELPVSPLPPDGTVEVRYFFALEWAEWITDWEAAARLAPFHVWRDDVVRERFEYDDEPGIQCAFGRIYRLTSPWTFSDRPSFGGCRSWITLPEFLPGEFAIEPVLSDEQHDAVAARVRNALGLQTAEATSLPFPR